MGKLVKLCTVWGEKEDMLPHFISHYRHLGVSEFRFILHDNGGNADFINGMKAALDSYIIEPIIYRGVWNGQIGTGLINKEINKHPDDWFVIADQDELQLYPDPISDIIDELDSEKHDYITGAFIDRLAENGNLRNIESFPSIWEQFPYCGFVSFPLARANPHKITMCKGRITLSEGQHGVVLPNHEYPVTSPVISQVHHFKWDASVPSRLESRLMQENKGDWNNSYAGYGDEVRRILKYLSVNDNKFSLTEPLFLVDKKPSLDFNYFHWDKVKEIMSTWPKLQSYPDLKLGGI